MNLNYRKFLMLLSLFTIFIIQSCSDDDPDPIKPGAEGFFIVNEGGFGNTNTSISFYNQETDQITNDLFAAVNGRPLGDQAQSMAVHEGKGYIMVQGTGKIEVIDADEYNSIATITEDIESPRYFQGVSTTKAYVSDWGADGMTGTVKVIDLAANKVTKTIATGQGANKMLKVGNFVYVTNSGGYGADNTIKIIDTSSDAIAGSITVGDNPNSIVADAAGNFWVTSAGTIAYNADWSIDEENSTPGSLSKISGNNTETFRLEVDIITNATMSSLAISPDGRNLYYNFNGNVYKMSTSATSLPTTPFRAKGYYSIAVNPFNGNVIGCEAPNFSSAGSFDVIDENGVMLGTHIVGIAPNGCAFK